MKLPAPRNAFERAEAASLSFRASWWKIAIRVLREREREVQVSRPSRVLLENEQPTVGSVQFDRRTVKFRPKRKKKLRAFVVSRPVDVRLSSLPFEAVEALANDLVAEAEQEWRREGIKLLIETARAQTHQDCLEAAREFMGEDASDEELENFASQMKYPAQLLEGGDVAARYFDENVSVASIDEGADGVGRLLDPPPPPPGLEPFGDSEWDFYSAEELLDRGGPESDWAYAFRVSTLCKALRPEGTHSRALAVQLGAVIREWEIWREFGEFIEAGIQKFARQYSLAKSKPERPWMVRVRKDWEEGKIGSPVSQYARALKRDRSLATPNIERIRNFVSELRRSTSS